MVQKVKHFNNVNLHFVENIFGHEIYLLQISKTALRFENLLDELQGLKIK